MEGVMVKERPILFSGEMVRAILDGRKTQTRRICRPAMEGGMMIDGPANQVHPCLDGTWVAWYGPNPIPVEESQRAYPTGGFKCPYGVTGDRLWVRETWAPICEFDPESVGCLYREDPIFDTTEKFEWKWRPSIHMPRWASRITLEVTGVRVERLQDISESDAWLEGVTLPDSEMETYYSGFRRLWESINGPESWLANPWVWAISFRRINCA